MKKINNQFSDKIKSNFFIDEKDISITSIQHINSITNDNLELQEHLLNFLIIKLMDTSNPVGTTERYIFNKLKEIKNMRTKLDKIFPNGIISFRCYLDTAYKELNNMLKEQKFKEADKITQTYLIQLVQQNTNTKRKWLYFTDIYLIPAYDLFLIDLLWKVYSDNKFGFSIQRNIWLSCNKNWNLFLEKINWNNKSIMKRYPDEFVWNRNAPKGHLPLFNQIRGNQVFLSLLQHHVWIQYY
uniref:GUN4-like domain-containing protein n=1 Tax=Caloglossa monosticha TaxID=76906 RepID=A0A1Z1M4H0_9FLOR|nr:hypothetical protein [Caloglossa monosticha]ARW60958.1 hypothetical protein [Caloglossa monosticha]